MFFHLKIQFNGNTTLNIGLSDIFDSVFEFFADFKLHVMTLDDLAPILSELSDISTNDKVC